ncbi:beta strand repeat-containing protein [Mucisphaera calidilacus]|uniref:PEP-CTERM protein-sorting domain-containing protein n=1 Tax=Mucisphaera calidilacus TaxID=2527982 RepID=A0A518BTU1_9BACT|nr:hypothetical protein [Mucisphaera calidilacus]QDU70379.1 hypothetical protein Pan265_02050 [Mucisphaera calidilacus]
MFAFRVCGYSASAYTMAALLSAAMSAQAAGDVFTWVGGAGTAWNTADNWVNETSPGTIKVFPRRSDTATFPAGVAAVAGGGEVGGITIAPGGMFTMTFDDLTVLGEIDNAGVFAFQNHGFSNTERLSLNGPVTLTGGGEVLMTSSDAKISQLFGTGGLINTDNTIRGNGRITASVTNAGVIRAENGTLLLATTDNTGGAVQVASNGRLSLIGALSGGTLTGEGGKISGEAFRDLTVNGLLVVSLDDAKMAGAINNTGTITFQNSGFSNNEVLGVVEQVTLTGGGEFVLNSSEARIEPSSGSGEIVNVDNTLRGVGRISSAITNQGLIRAENGTLYIGTTDNTGGEVEIAGNGRLHLLGELSNGVIVGEPGGLIAGVGIRDVTTTGTVTVSSSDLGAAGTLNNTGLITFENSGFSNYENLGLHDQVTLTGGGTVILNSGDARITQASGTGGLVNIDNTIRTSGRGNLLVDVTNTGTVAIGGGSVLNLGGTLSGGTLDIEPGGLIIGGLIEDVTNVDTLTVSMDDRPVRGTLDNRGTIRFQNSGFANNEILGLHGQVTLTGNGEVIMTSADARINQVEGVGGLVNLNNTISGNGSINVPLVNHDTVIASGGRLILSETDNANGEVVIRDGARLRLGGSLVGGRLVSEGNVWIDGNGLEDVEMSGMFRVSIDELVVRNGITNTGVITYENSGFSNVEALWLDGQVTLDGGGAVILNSSDAWIAQFGETTGGLINIDNTIRIDGRGTIKADIDNRGVVEVPAGSLLDLSGTIRGGTLRIAPGGVIVGGLLEDFTLEGTMTVSISDRLIGGDIHNTGVITFENSGFANHEILYLNDTVMLTGGGEIVLSNHEAIIRKHPDAASGGILNRDNTIRGFGSLEVDIQNGGIVRAENGRLRASGNFIQTSGSIEVAPGAEFEFNGDSLETGSVVIEEEGTFDFNGDLLFTRRIEGDFDHDTGTFQPLGRTRGFVLGDYTQLSTEAELLISLYSYIQGLQVTGDLTLMGQLEFSGDYYNAVLGESYTFIHVDGLLTGTFDGLAEGALVTRFNGIDMFITYRGGDGNDVALYSIPEPAGLTILGLGCALLRRRGAA